VKTNLTAITEQPTMTGVPTVLADGTSDAGLSPQGPAFDSLSDEQEDESDMTSPPTLNPTTL
jgi:hypothetical protein